MKFKFENLYELKQLLRHLASGLSRLTLNDNLEGTEIEISILSGTETEIRNPLNFIPTRYIILGKTGNSTISRSGTWTSDFLYFTNHGVEDTTATIFLMR